MRMLERIVNRVKASSRSLGFAAAVGAASMANAPAAAQICTEECGESVSMTPNNDIIPQPHSITWNPYIAKFVITDASSVQFYTMNLNGQQLQVWNGPTLMSYGRGITQAAGYMYVANNLGEVEELHPNTGVRIANFDTLATSIAGITYDIPSNSLLIYDQGTGSGTDQMIHQYSLQGQHRASIASH